MYSGNQNLEHIHLYCINEKVDTLLELKISYRHKHSFKLALHTSKQTNSRSDSCNNVNIVIFLGNLENRKHI